MSDQSDSGRDRDEVYRVEDADGETLPGGEYSSRDAAINRRASEMVKHPDGDDVTVERYELATDGGAVAFPPDHPLAPYADDLDDHESHLDAFSDVLDDADGEDVQAAMLVLTGEAGTDTLPSVSQDVDARWASLWMLGAHIHHVASAASQATGEDRSMVEVAKDAIEAISEHSGPQEVYD